MGGRRHVPRRVRVSGHTVVMDGPEDLGGRNLGPRPMEMLLLGTGGCAMYDVVSMLKKARQSVTATAASSCPGGAGRRRARGVHARQPALRGQRRRTSGKTTSSAPWSCPPEKYCSASIMLAAAGVEVSHSYAIEAPAG
jgi:putative redox protein